MAALKNVTRVETTRLGRTTWLLIDQSGDAIEAFSYFCEKNWGYAYATQKRYAEAVSQFIDYLIEARVFSAPAPTARLLNTVIELYPFFLIESRESLYTMVSDTIEQFPEDRWLLDVCRSLDRPPISPSSLTNTLAAINRFLKLSESVAVVAYEKAAILGVYEGLDYRELFNALSGRANLSQFEITNLKINSVLGCVIRFNPRGLTRPRGLRSPVKSPPAQSQAQDFPIEHVMNLVAQGTSWRDKTLWLLLAASGIRVSEALALQWSDIDLDKREVHVLDPNGRRFGRDMTRAERTRFKGRQMSMTVLIEPFKTYFYQSLEKYLKEEFVPYKTSSPDYVFQYVEPRLRGRALIEASDTALSKGFKGACSKARVANSNEKPWTLHSLRHMYGVYMLNDYPVDREAGIFGLSLIDVQMLMGHKSTDTTRKYARRTRRKLDEIMKNSDEFLVVIKNDKPN